MSWERWPPSRPIRVDGGLKARSTRGEIAQTWWSRRFIEVLEALGLGSRLTRGRSYARQGQVLSLRVAAGSVEAVVQGSRRRPYDIWIELAVFTDRQWARVEGALAEQAFFRAKLLAGEMPHDVEEVFAGCGLSLFPSRPHELSMDCSCPDWAVPCKHLAAVFYLLAEGFDVDPFLVLAWRGRTKDELLANLRELAGHGPGDDRTPVGGESQGPDERPLADLMDRFWVGGPWELPATAQPIAPDLVLREVEPPALEASRRPLADLLRPAYDVMAADT